MPSLIATLGLNASQFNAALGRATGQAANAGRGITGALGRVSSSFGGQLAGMVGIAGMGAMVKRTLDWAGALQDAADSLDVTTDFLQRMQNGAMTAGGTLEDVQKLMVELNKSRLEALKSPSGKESQAFSRLGISGADTANLSAEAFVQKLADAFKNGTTANLQSDLIEVGGKSGKNLLAAFANGFNSELPTISDDIIGQLDDIGDQFANTAQRVTIALAPVLAQAASLLNRGARATTGAATFYTHLAGNILGSVVAGEGLNLKESYKEALADGQEAMQKWDEQQTAQDAASKARRDARNARAQRSPIELSQIAMADTASKSRQGYVNSLQQIGAYNAAPQMAALDIARRSLATQQSIDAGIKKLATKSGTTY